MFKSDEILKKKDVNLIVFCGRNPSSIVNFYDKAYSQWRDTWGTHFKERDHLTHLYSDNFTRQDDILGLFWKDTCLALVCFRYIDLNIAAHRDDSYFEPWRPEDLTKLGKFGNNVAIGSQISIVSGCPQFENSVRMREIILYLSYVHMKESGVAAYTGTARKDKGMHETFSQYGAQTLNSDVSFHHGLVEIMAFYPQHIKPKIRPEVVEVGSFLWKNKKNLKNALADSFKSEAA